MVTADPMVTTALTMDQGTLEIQVTLETPETLAIREIRAIRETLVILATRVIREILETLAIRATPAIQEIRVDRHQAVVRTTAMETETRTRPGTPVTIITRRTLSTPVRETALAARVAEAATSAE